MKLSELKSIVDTETKAAKRAGTDPEIRFLILPNFPTALSVVPMAVSSLDSSLSKECREQGSFLYLAEDKDEGAVWGEVADRFGWERNSPWSPPMPKELEVEVSNGRKEG